MSSKNTTRKFHDFIMLPAWLYCRSISEISDGAKILYCRLIRYMGDNDVCWPSIDALSKEIGKCDRQVKRLLKELIELKLITSIRLGKKCTNRYKLPVHPWMSEEMTSDRTEMSHHSESDRTYMSPPMEVTHMSPPYKENQEKESIYIVGPSEPTNNFDEFWSIWPRKSEGKQKARELIKKMSENEFKKLMDGTRRYITYIAQIRSTGFNRDYLMVQTFLRQKQYLESWELPCARPEHDLSNFMI